MVNVIIKNDGTSIRLDSRYANSFDGYEFISHAHRDHLSSARTRKRVICTDETVVLSIMRGLNLETANMPPNFKLLLTGHILGAAGLNLEGSFFYTGDIKLNTYAFDRPQIPRVKCLLIESTFGSLAYKFPKPLDVLSEALDKIKELLKKNVPCVLLGYSLGKAQHLQMFFDGKTECNKYVTQDISVYNDVYSLFGKDIVDKPIVTNIVKKKLESKPWILYYPMRYGEDPFLSHLRNQYNASFFAFTGWAINPNFLTTTEIDYAYPLSDHADFQELLTIAKMADPDRIFVIGGQSTELCEAYHKLGFHSTPIINGEVTIDLREL